MTGNLDMGMKNILNVDTLNDYTNNSEKDRDLKSAVNKRYLNTHFLKIIGKGDNDFNLGGQIIKNCEPYYDGLFDDNSLVSKAFVDAEIKKIPSAPTDVLKTDGSKAMAGDIWIWLTTASSILKNQEHQIPIMQLLLNSLILSLKTVNLV